MAELVEPLPHADYARRALDTCGAPVAWRRVEPGNVIARVCGRSPPPTPRVEDLEGRLRQGQLLDEGFLYREVRGPPCMFYPLLYQSSRP